MHAAGSVAALVMFKVTPREALLLKASQRHSASVLSTVLSPLQQERAGFASVPPLETKDKHSAMLSMRVVQSTDGAGAAVWRLDAP